jgi:hypothetical protein
MLDDWVANKEFRRIMLDRLDKDNKFLKRNREKL